MAKRQDVISDRWALEGQWREGKIRSWRACSILLRSLDLILWLVERTEGCKQLIELVPVTVSCARLLTDASLKSHNTPAK